jgi:hypothetical protein
MQSEPFAWTQGPGVSRERVCSADSDKIRPVRADTDRGVKADADGRLEALLVTTPPPTDAEHEPVRDGLKTGEFDP